MDADALFKERTAQSLVNSALLLCYGHADPIRKHNRMTRFFEEEFNVLEGLEGVRPSAFDCYSQVLSYEATVRITKTKPQSSENS